MARSLLRVTSTILRSVRRSPSDNLSPRRSDAASIATSTAKSSVCRSRPGPSESRRAFAFKMSAPTRLGRGTFPVRSPTWTSTTLVRCSACVPPGAAMVGKPITDSRASARAPIPSGMRTSMTASPRAHRCWMPSALAGPGEKARAWSDPVTARSTCADLALTTASASSVGRCGAKPRLGAVQVHQLATDERPVLRVRIEEIEQPEPGRLLGFGHPRHDDQEKTSLSRATAR